MEEMILSIMNQFGYIGVLLLIAIENVFPPIPSEVILLFGGFMTTYTELNVIGMIIFSTLGSLIGAIVLYYIGKILNKERLKKIVSGKVGKILRLKNSDIDNNEDKPTFGNIQILCVGNVNIFKLYWLLNFKNI